jgi:hypothetical protein
MGQHRDNAEQLQPCFARRDTAPLGEQLAAFMWKENVGCDLVASGENAPTQLGAHEDNANTIRALLVAREGIEHETESL